MSLREACTALLVFAFTGLVEPRHLAAEPGAPSLQDLIIVTDDDATGGLGNRGCDEISVIDGRTGEAVGYSHYDSSPGRVACTSDATLLLSVYNNGRRQFVRIMMMDKGGDQLAWSSADVSYTALEGSPIAISPDDLTILLVKSPSGVVKHRVADVALRSLGRPAGVFPGVRPAEILFSADSKTAYLVDIEGAVYIIDVATMRADGSPIPYEPTHAAMKRRIRNTFADLSPDGRYIVISTLSSKLWVIDLQERHALPLDAPGLLATHDISFNLARAEQTMLAVHGEATGGKLVTVYRFNGAQRLETLASAYVRAEVLHPRSLATARERSQTISWTGRGDGVIAAIGGEWKEYVILDFPVGPPWQLTPRLEFDACTRTVEEEQTPPGNWSLQLDVITLQRPGMVPTPTATEVPTATGTDVPATATPTAPDTARPTITASVTACPTPTDSFTPQPGPVYLSIALREQCTPGQQHTDVALVIDASTSMRDEFTSTGRRKLDAARDAVALFVGQLDLAGGDQAAIVQFNAEAALLSPLTHDRAELEQALSTIEVARQTRIQAGIRLAREELISSRRRAVNSRAMVVLTDGANNPEPVAEAEREAVLARADGIRVFTIGLGVEVEGDALSRMATSAADYFYAPDGEDLAAIYRRIAHAIPCPAEAFWGGR